ncbi:MAG: ComF family protein [bacterium]|nr:ComF family protein [bacterium]
MTVFVGVKNFLLDLLFPVECLGCGTAGTYLCAACFAKIPIEEAFICPMCARPSFEGATCAACYKKRGLNGLIAAAAYDAVLVRRLVTGCKYRFVKDMAEPMAHLILKRLASHAFSVFYRKDILLVPVPLSPRRLRHRGFNQADEIARIVARQANVAVSTEALVRVSNTHPQVEMESRGERRDNIRDAFAIANSQNIRGRAVVLVDDVATTLATLGECARVLKKAGAAEVWGLVVAREWLKR